MSGLYPSGKVFLWNSRDHTDLAGLDLNQGIGGEWPAERSHSTTKSTSVSPDSLQGVSHPPMKKIRREN